MTHQKEHSKNGRTSIVLPAVLLCAALLAFTVSCDNGNGTTPGENSGNKRELYQKTCDNIARTMKELAADTSAATPAQLARAAARASEEDYVVAVGGQREQIKAVAVFIDFVASMMQNQKFTVTDLPVKFTCDYDWGNNRTQKNEVTLMYSFDEAGDRVEMHWNVNTREVSGTTSTESSPKNIFLYIGVDYDFANAAVVAFDVFVESAENNATETSHYIYKDDILKVLDTGSATDTSSVAAALEGHKSALTSKESSAIDLGADFTTEYTAAMDAMNPTN